MTDYAGAIWMPNQNFFPDSGKKAFIILHGTAGGTSAQEIANFFKGTEGGSNPISSHYIVGKDGVVVQTVAEKDGAWGNGVVTNSNWLGNPNNYTISIEYVKSSIDNSDALTPAQQAASFALIKDICIHNGIGMYAADMNSGIASHADIDPVNRSRCPGAYPWDELWAFLQGGQPVNTRPAPSQVKAANDSWDSVLQPGNLARKATGIYQAWLAALVEGKFYGPPISQEYDSVDWGGQHIVVQEFAHARCEWNGTPNWYGPSGKI